MVDLCALVTMPEHNLILDPFAGSGTTGVACAELGLPCVLIEKDGHSVEIAGARVMCAEYIELAKKRTSQMGLFAQGSSN